MPPSTTFSRPVIIEYGSPPAVRRRAIGTLQHAGECLLHQWPKEGRGPAHLAALRACREAIAGRCETEIARRAFITAAKEVGIFLEEE